MKINIAIDGYSSCGKGTIAKSLAQILGYRFIDTGAMYRAFAWWTLHGHPVVDDCPLDMSTNPEIASVHVGGVDVTDAIRGPEVTAEVSRVAADPAVRAEAVRRQRDIIAAAVRGIVVEGRDITTVVAPDADVRIFLTADLAAREARRAAEFAHDARTAEAVAAAVATRDRIDSTRAHSPLQKVAGVTEIDATHRTLDDVITMVTDMVTETQQHE